jgi:hypothetical protein
LPLARHSQNKIGKETGSDSRSLGRETSDGFSDVRASFLQVNLRILSHQSTLAPKREQRHHGKPFHLKGTLVTLWIYIGMGILAVALLLLLRRRLRKKVNTDIAF